MTDSFFRRVWRWHFWAGLAAAPVLLVVALTGALCTFRAEIEDAARPELAFVEPGANRRPLDELLTAIRAAHPDQKPVRATVSSDPARSVTVLVEPVSGPPSGTARAVFVDPYTGAVLGDGPARSPFFAGVLKLHRTLFADTFGRVVVELTTSWTLVLLVSGLALWWPARAGKVWGVWLPRLRGPRYRVLRDLHAVPAAYLAPVAVLVAVTGLFYTVVWLWGYNAATGAGNFPAALRAGPPAVPTGAKPVPAEVALAAARERWPGKSYTVQLPKKPTDAYAVTVRGAGAGGPSVYGLVAVDPFSGAVTADVRHDALPLLERARLWVLPIHMGTVAGTPTKVLALVTCLALAGLAVSGVWMWLARRPAGRWGFPRASAAPVPKPATVLILALALFLPTVALSLVAVLLSEWLVERVRRSRSPDSPPPADPVPARVPVLSDPQEVSAS